jgi:acetolactate synthase-1/2/3 large subunit
LLTGADVLVRELAALDVTTCFANPGTSEVDLVRALDTLGSIRSCLALHENVVTGAADGYARITDHPAMALVHLGPGLANGIANLHNARRAHSPVVTVVGQHPTWHLAADSPLSSDIESLAGVVSCWVGQPTDVSDLGQAVHDAVAAARRPPKGVATLIVPMDVQRAEAAPHRTGCFAAAPNRPVAAEQIAAAIEALRKGAATILWLGRGALSAEGLVTAARIQAATDCRVFSESFPSRLERGGGLPAFPSVPYFPEHASVAIKGASAHVFVGMARPVYMFGGPNGSSSPVPANDQVVELADDAPHCVLEMLASALGPLPDVPHKAPEVRACSGSLDPESAGITVARLVPDGAVVVDESGTSGTGYQTASAASARHVRLGVTGGSIGMGLPVAIGAAVASPDRRVIALEADGSGMYTVQSLWTMARESLDITVVVLANRRYAILETEFARAGTEPIGALASSLIDLSNPTLDWVRLAEGHGVPATRVTTVEDLETALARSFADPGPALVEAVI